MLVPDGDLSAFADAVTALVSDSSRWRAAGVAAHKRARDFSWEACARAHAEVFTEAEARASCARMG